MEVIINNNSYNVKCMMTDKDIKEGMQLKKFDSTFDGMMFMMGYGNHSFWMYNCVIPLDIIYISHSSNSSNRHVISKIYSNCPPCREENPSECINYPGTGDIVLEIPGGDCLKYDMRVGDSVLIEE
jgi:uncharacterized membrane protein (UPF0127 family)